MTVTPVIIDCDTGIDDAFALMFAVRHPEIDLRAVTCVAGNAAVDRVVANTRYVLDAAGAAEIPVGRGAAAATGWAGSPGLRIGAARRIPRWNYCGTSCRRPSRTGSRSPWSPLPR